MDFACSAYKISFLEKEGLIWPNRHSHPHYRLEHIAILWGAEKLGLESVADVDPESKEEFLETVQVDMEPKDFHPEDYGSFNEYGLGFDWVGSDTFDDQEQGYFRYQLSWGGPSDEFRFYVDPDLTCFRIEYWFLDWFDGASRTLSGTDKDMMMEIFEMFKEVGTCQHLLDEAREE